MNSSKRISFLFLILIYFSSFILAVIVPPLQSPDERDHIKRAYFLLHGQIVLTSPQNRPSGGMIDSGLEHYLEFSEKYTTQADVKVTQEDLKAFREMKWSGTKVFSSAPGTGYYFPIIYTPQAMAIAFSNFLGLGIDKTYTATRYFVLVSSFFILLYAFYIYELGFFVLAILALPMNIFQASASSIDGLSLSITVLIISIFLSIIKKKQEINSVNLSILSLSIFTVSTCRTHMLTLLSIFFIIYYYNRKKPVLVSGIIVSILSVLWTLIAMKSVVNYNQNMHTLSAVQRFVHYINHPGNFFSIFYRTLSDKITRKAYFDEFVGVLGWLNVRFSGNFYRNIYILLSLLLVCCINRTRDIPFVRLCMTGMAFCSIFIVFLSILLTWTNDGSTEIEGVQGRYFMLPFLVLAYANFNIINENKKLYVASIFFTSMIFILSSSTSVWTIIYKYYITN